MNISDTCYNETDASARKICKEFDLLFGHPTISIAASVVRGRSDKAVAHFQIFYLYGFKKDTHDSFFSTGYIAGVLSPVYIPMSVFISYFYRHENLTWQ